MKFFPTFFGSFYSAKLYRDVRVNERGVGATYALIVLLLEMIGIIYGIMTVHRDLLQNLVAAGNQAGPALWLTIIAIALPVRAGALFVLAIAARLISYKAKPFISYTTALRMAAVAYTPIAMADLVVFYALGSPIFAPVTFGLGVLMLLAALVASRGE